MLYMLKTVKNEEDRLVFATEYRGGKYVYFAKAENGEVGVVDSDWIRKNKDYIVNLGIDGYGFYPDNNWMLNYKHNIGTSNYSAEDNKYMKYELAAGIDEKYRKQFKSKKIGNETVYLAKSAAGECGVVNLDWILKNHINIINLYVNSDNYIYPLEYDILMYELAYRIDKKGRKVFKSEKRGNKTIYFASKSSGGLYAEVDLNWILKNQKYIKNLGISGTSIYPVEEKNHKINCCKCGAIHKISALKPITSDGEVLGYICENCLKKKYNFNISKEDYKKCFESLGKAYFRFNLDGRYQNCYDIKELIEEYGTYDKNKYDDDLEEYLDDYDFDFETFIREANIDYYRIGLLAIEDYQVDEYYSDNSLNDNELALLYKLRDILLNWKENKQLDYSDLCIFLLKNLIDNYYEDYSGFIPYYLNVKGLEKDYMKLYKKEHNALKVKQKLLNKYAKDLDAIYSNQIELAEYDYDDELLCVFVSPLCDKIEDKTFKYLFDEKYLNAYKKFYLKFLSLVIDAVYKKIENKNYNLDFIEDLTMDDFGMQNGKVKLCNEKNREAYKLLGLDVENY